MEFGKRGRWDANRDLSDIEVAKFLNQTHGITAAQWERDLKRERSMYTHDVCQRIERIIVELHKLEEAGSSPGDPS